MILRLKLRLINSRFGKFCLGLLGVGLVVSAFPSRFGHILWIPLVCFTPVILCIRATPTLWKKVLLTWVLFQALFIWMFAYLPPHLPPGIPNSNQFWSIWLLILLGPVIYSGLFLLAIRWSSRVLGGALLAGSIMVLGEQLFFGMLFKFPLTFAITVFDQPVLIQLAALGGWAAVSWLLWSSNFYFSNLEYIRERRVAMALGAACLIGVIGFGFLRITCFGHDVGHRVSRLAVVQTNTSWVEMGLAGISPLYFHDHIGNVAKMTRVAATLNPAAIVFPEGVAGRGLGDQMVFDKIRSISKEVPFPILLECRITTPENSSASAAIWMQNGGIERQRYKTFTVPFIEATGTENRNVNVYFGIDRDIDIAALICFEILFSKPSRDLALEGADILICHANTSYFGQSNWPILHGAYTSLRAVESGRSIVLVNDTGYSLGADALGRIFWGSGSGKSGVYLVPTPAEKIDPLTLRYANLIWIGLVATVIWGGVRVCIQFGDADLSLSS